VTTGSLADGQITHRLVASAIKWTAGEDTEAAGEGSRIGHAELGGHETTGTAGGRGEVSKSLIRRFQSDFQHDQLLGGRLGNGYHEPGQLAP
jgi:hypothetical protein